jgi:hypothetical protein
VLLTFTATNLDAWSRQGHRLVAMVAANHLTPAAKQNVKWLLDDATLADVAVWADDYVEANNQTGRWHYVDLPLDAAAYDRNRDCPIQPGVRAGGRGDTWRDCAVDRILYNQQRLADARLDRTDRAIALKFLVHLIGDLHQPFHALALARGGNDTPVSVFGRTNCTYGDGARYTCNLHGTWDTALVAHRGLSDMQYVAELERRIQERGWLTNAAGTPAEWALESNKLAKTALLPSGGVVDEAYYRRHISGLDDRIAKAGLRLAAVLNQTLTAPPPAR